MAARNVSNVLYERTTVSGIRTVHGESTVKEAVRFVRRQIVDDPGERSDVIYVRAGISVQVIDGAVAVLSGISGHLGGSHPFT